MKKNFRFYVAMFMGKLARLVQRLLGMNATFFPGKLAVKICPDFLGRIDRPETIICVTGTNGKTTVCNLILDALEQNGYDVMSNRLGSNVNAGIATSFVADSTMLGKAKKNIAVLEVDERSSKLIYPYIKPDYIICGNLFRDSIQRNAHPEFIFNFINDNLPEHSKLILNADDMISGNLGDKQEKVYFSINRLPSDTDTCRNLINDCRICPKCHKPLQYEYVRYHHIGKAVCANCGYTSPKGDYVANLNFDDMDIEVTTPNGVVHYPMVQKSVFNNYNQLIVIAFLSEFGFSAEQIKQCFENLSIVESRYSDVEKNGVKIVTNLAKEKNPIACSIVFDYVSKEPGNKEIVLMLDDIPYRKVSSENMTWAYESDFEFLNQPDITNIVITGHRIQDLKLRLLLAGIPEEKLKYTYKEEDAAAFLSLDNTDAVYILHTLHVLEETAKVKSDILEKLEAKGATANG